MFQTVRKAIARVLTVLSEKRIDAARAEKQNQRRVPRDLRLKKSRAFRRRLSAFEAKKLTLKQQKKADNFKVRKYALIA